MKKVYTLENFHQFLKKYPVILKYHEKVDVELELIVNVKENRINDFCWRLFNEAIMKNTQLISTGEDIMYLRNCADIYYQMAHFRREEGASKETINRFIRLSFEFMADFGQVKGENRNALYEMVVIAPPAGDCSYADSVNSECFEFHEFHTKCHIATDKCTSKFGFCRCTTAERAKRDESGRILRNKL